MAELTVLSCYIQHFNRVHLRDLVQYLGVPHEALMREEGQARNSAVFSYQVSVGSMDTAMDIFK